MSLDFTHATLATARTETQREGVFSLSDGQAEAALHWCLTFVLAHFLDPRQRIDLHQRVGDADHVHHVHHTLQKTHMMPFI